MTTAMTQQTSPRRAGQRRIGSHLFLLLAVLYFVVPLWWLVVGSTKSNSGLFVGSGGALWFNDEFALWDNVKQLFTYQGGIYWTWMRNSFVYAIVGGVGSRCSRCWPGTPWPSTGSAAATSTSPCCWAP